jgi:hypothetical protein
MTIRKYTIIAGQMYSQVLALSGICSPSFHIPFEISSSYITFLLRLVILYLQSILHLRILPSPHITITGTLSRVSTGALAWTPLHHREPVASVLAVSTSSRFPRVPRSANSSADLHIHSFTVLSSSARSTGASCGCRRRGTRSSSACPSPAPCSSASARSTRRRCRGSPRGRRRLARTRTTPRCRRRAWSGAWRSPSPRTRPCPCRRTPSPRRPPSRCPRCPQARRTWAPLADRRRCRDITGQSGLCCLTCATTPHQPSPSPSGPTVASPLFKMNMLIKHPPRTLKNSLGLSVVFILCPRELIWTGVAGLGSSMTLLLLLCT